MRKKIEVSLLVVVIVALLAVTSVMIIGLKDVKSYKIISVRHSIAEDLDKDGVSTADVYAVKVTDEDGNSLELLGEEAYYSCQSRIGEYIHGKEVLVDGVKMVKCNY